MARFKAIAKGYYGDVIHDPDTDHHVYFDAPADLDCSWAVRVDGAEEEVPAEREVSEDTLAAEKILDTEAEAGRTAELAVSDSDDVPADTGVEEDVNAATGVETL